MSKLYKAFQSITPDNFDEIKESVKIRNDEVTVNMETNRKKRRYVISAIALACVMVFMVPFALQKNNAVFATVGVDVNPSVALDINEKEKVVHVTTNNDEGKQIVDNMDLKGSDIDVAMNALIGSMLKHGYIDELKNSLLISVTGDHAQDNERIRQEMIKNVDELLKSSQIDGSIVSQTLDSTADLESLAQKYNISVGKAEIIQQLVNKNSLYTFESLKDLSVNDLNILLASNHVENVQVSGQASTGSYIGETKAKQIVEKDANVTSPTYTTVELDYDDGKMIYDLEFYKDSTEYEYEVDAVNGNIMKKEKDTHRSSSHSQSNSSTSSTKQISKDEAKSIAMKHAGVSSISNEKIEQDYDDGVLEYDIDFISGNKKYEYKISGNGNILEHEVKDGGNVKISGNDAKNTALKHAGVSYKDIRDLDVELENSYYDISFETSSYEYEYKIDASSGKVVHHQKERND